MRVYSLDNSGFEETLITSSTVQLVDNLQCCSDYRFSVSSFTNIYGPFAPDVTFRTYADLSSKTHLQEYA